MTQPNNETNFSILTLSGLRDLELRPYQSADHEQVRRLFIAINRELAPPSLADKFADYIEQSLREEVDRIPDYYHLESGNSFWVAVRSVQVLGFFGLEAQNPKTVELRRMYVRKCNRRAGLGRSLLQAAETIAQRAKFEVMVLSTSEIQQAALGLYRASGYQLVREERSQNRTNKTVGSNLLRFHFEKRL